MYLMPDSWTLSWVNEQFNTLSPKLQLDALALTVCQVNFANEAYRGVSAQSSPPVPLAVGTFYLPARVLLVARRRAVGVNGFGTTHHFPAWRFPCPKVLRVNYLVGLPGASH